MINVAVLGYGVVGSGVVEVIRKNNSSISKKSGQEITVKKILDVRDFPDSPDRDLLTKDSEEIFNDKDIHIVVETIGGAKIAYEFTKRALRLRKHVVTSNKELVATHGPELLQLAKENGVHYLFEASVGGGIPIIRPLNQCLAANEIKGITGILNGTTNYILTQMRREGKDFYQALKEAQQNGYAEADPTADIEGYDTCRKIAILSSIAYNEFVDYNNIYTEGITKITPVDMEYAEELNSVIKLIAFSKRAEKKIIAWVSPAMVEKSHPLATVEDVFNGIVVKGDAIGEAMFYGRGAGKLPTASAVVADIIDIVKHLDSGARNIWTVTHGNNVIPMGETFTRYFIRLKVRNFEEAGKLVTRAFGKVEWVKAAADRAADEIAFTTCRDAEKNLQAALGKLKGTGSIKEVASVIRMLDE
ncbi:MAG: homoserine dehydrogenase [Clostridiales bacterium]|jgi:homoserine dehydrogenase|nr:homoserine dehydrogenase [Eubacteriales bacterium]MDH7565548.1 homoserine dehydrogenase [Clostridiales bacterium]